MASVTYRGNPSTISDPSNYTTVSRDVTGSSASVTVNGITTSVSTSTTTNYAAPEQLTVGSLYTTNTYNSFLGLTNETDQNSSGISLGYDSYARPTSSTSPFGATAGTAYYDTATPPYVLTGTSASSRWTKTILDGLGRTLEVDAGDSGGTHSVAESVYDSCGCSPLGKLTKQAVPHAYGGDVHYTTYTYDGIGRTLSIQAPDGASTTTYSYSANLITVTDPAGKWKKFTMDVVGNLVQVNEPNPAGGADYVTTYSYDGLNHLTGVSMTRGSTTQTRTFEYNGNYLTRATNPENGAVNYTYNGYGKVATRIDAKNQKVAYSYDSYARLTEVQRYPLSTGSEDLCQQETYYYDSNPFDGGSYSHYTAGRLTAVQYYGGITSFGCSSMDYNHTTFQEWYNYGIPGAPVGKKLRVTRNLNLVAPPYIESMNVDLNGTFSYDTEGKMTSEGYPTDNGGATASLAMSYDTMGRLYTLTDQLASVNIIASASYGPANELLSMTAGSYSGNWGSESRSYNVMKQLTSLSSNGVSLTYSYSSTQNNGKITSQYDTVSGETVSYTYDSLNRLYTAAATSGGSWSQTYAYDGFGNLTSITGNAAASYSYNSATNQGSCSDWNGNSNEASCSGISYGYTYDIENRVVITPTGGLGGRMLYSYAPGNKRVWRGNGGATDEITFWSPSGQKLGAYAITATAQGYVGSVLEGPYFYATQTGTNYYFGGKLIKNAGGWVYSDRLGSIGKYYPYGQERPSATTNGTEKFAGYFRDAETGLDYADQRYHQPGVGRFMTVDPSGGSADAQDPGSWNRYAYVEGDPVNSVDPEGLLRYTGPGSGDPTDPTVNGEIPGSGLFNQVCGVGNHAAPRLPIGNALLPPQCFNDVVGGTYNSTPPHIPKPTCSDSASQFIANNFSTVLAVANSNGVPVDWLFAWIAQESTWGSSAEATQNGNFLNATKPVGQAVGSWSGEVACGAGAYTGTVLGAPGLTFSCFPNLAASLNAAFASANYGPILSSASTYSSAASFFQAVAQAGWDRSDPVGYGTRVGHTVTGVDSRMTCLGLAP